MSGTPAGWYPDHERPGAFRYWNGTAWTEQRSTTQPSPPPPGAANTTMSPGAKKGCLGIVMAVFVVGFFVSMFDDSSSDSAGTEYGAKSACQDWVEDQLKAPSTADFGGVNVSGVGPWTVTGYVDAENSFGANVRTAWACDVRLDSDDYYRGSATLLE